MMLVVFQIDEPLDREAVQPIIEAVISIARPALAQVVSDLKGFIAVDEAADEIMATIFKPTGTKDVPNAPTG